MGRLGEPKLKEREMAIDLRKQGLTYREILQKVPVAKSTLSVWLGSVRLSVKQKQRITDKRIAAGLRGADKQRSKRIKSTEKIISKTRCEVGTLSSRELWLIGVALYWAEGSKEKECASRNARVIFSNSDSRMVKLFILWLTESCGVVREDIHASIYIHESSRHRLQEVVTHWVRATGFSKEAFSNVYYKKHNPKTNRQNIGHSYYGNVRIVVRTSSVLSRRIAGWIEGVGL